MSTPVKRVAFHTLGCKLNFSEMSTISRDCAFNGFETVNFKEIADFYVINTCSVTENANKEARKLIRQAKLKNPDSSIAIIGCYAQLKPKELAAIDGVDIVLGADAKFNILQYLDKKKIKHTPDIIRSGIENVNLFKPSFSIEERTRSYLKVQDGCDYTCSFCTIPLARGKSRSATIEDTVKIAKKIIDSGKKEIVITGVNVGDFGKGTKESFFDLIYQLDMINNIKRIRISSIEPNLLTDEIIRFCYNSNKFVPHFHIPLQSGSDKILRSMQRRYTSKFYKSRIEKIKSLNSDTCIGVDVIVGFPGESDKDFYDTYEFISHLDISYLHVFSYSERSNTSAIKLANKIPTKLINQRSKLLRGLSNNKRNIFYDQFLNTKREVLFENIKDGKLVGYTDNYIKVKIDAEKHLVNTISSVNLSDNQGDFVYGRL